MPTLPVITWNPPAVLLAGMVVDSALNASANVAGSFVYSPVAGTPAALPPLAFPYTAVPATATLTCTFTPDDLGTYQVATAAVTVPLATAYTIPSEARMLMRAMPASLLGTLPTLSDGDLIPLLLTASEDIDVARRFQGRQLIEMQDRQFPRLAYGPPPITRQFAMGYPGLFGLVYPFSADTKIWDLDLSGASTGVVVAIVPKQVKLATIWQAAWLLRPEFAERMETIRSGLAAQSIGTGSENFIRSGDVAGGFTGLGARAIQIMEKYQLRSGRML